MKVIEIDGKKYKLVPLSGESESVLEGYKIDSGEHRTESEKQVAEGEIKDAVPKVSDYRERYKQRRIKASEITVPPKIRDDLQSKDSFLEGYNYKGEGLFFGEGLEQEF